MTRSGEKIRQSLHTTLTQAEIDFDMWVAMRTTRAEPEVVVMLNRRYGRFYLSAENAFFNSLITILYAVFESREDTVNFWSLRKTLQEDGNRVALEEIDNRLNLIKETWKKICIIRNEVVGHQTLKRTKTESHEIAGMTFDSIKGMIHSCQELLVFIANKFHDTHVSFNIQGAESFENLILDFRSSSSFAAVSKKLRNSP